jgi:hypothetical protein
MWFVIIGQPLSIRGLVQRLAGEEQVTQGRKAVLLDPLARELAEHAHRRGRREHHGYLVFVDDVPPDPGIRVVGRALVDHGRNACEQGAVDDVAVADDPADVRRGPVHVVLAAPVDVVHRGVQGDHVPAGIADDALRLPGRARRIQDVAWVRGLERLCRHRGAGDGRHLIAPAYVTARDGGPWRDAAVEHDDSAHARRRCLDCVVDDCLEVDRLSLALAPVGAHDDL